MGWGDDVITTSVVKRAFAKTGKPVCIGNGEIHWSAVFENNPKISRVPYPGAPWVGTIKGARPYIDYTRTTRERTVYREDFKVEPGEIFLTDAELAKWEGGRVYIEPNVKGSYAGNKYYPRWQEVVDALPDVPWVQGPGARLKGVEQVSTESFRDACALLAKCEFFVGTDGGLHHAAAALGKGAVVVWGGLVSPRILGYDTHINIHSGTYSCGSHYACDHCKRAIAHDPETIVKAIRELL